MVGAQTGIELFRCFGSEELSILTAISHTVIYDCFSGLLMCDCLSLYVFLSVFVGQHSLKVLTETLY